MLQVRGNTNTWWFFLLGLLGLVAAALFLMLPIRGANLLTGTAGWTSHGCFANGGFYPSTGFERRITAHERQGITLWGSFCGAQTDTGELRSPAFKAPVILELFVAGYPGPEKPGIQLALEKEDTHQRVPLPVSRLAGGMWVKLHWWTPGNWHGQPVRLIAIDHETATGVWLGVSNPRSLSVLNFFREEWRSWFRATSTFLYQWALFVLPGFAAACLMVARRREYCFADLSHHHRGLHGIGAWLSLLLGFLFLERAWKILDLCGLPCCHGSSGRSLYNSLAGRESHGSPDPPTASLHFVHRPLLYQLLFCLSRSIPSGNRLSERPVFAQILAADNVIPEIFADRIYDRKPVIPFCCTDWLSSDRPPCKQGLFCSSGRSV